MIRLRGANSSKRRGVIATSCLLVLAGLYAAGASWASPPLGSAGDDSRVVRFRFVGDVIFGRYKEDGYHRRPRETSHLFDEVRDVLRADFTLANLETPIVRTLPARAPVAGSLVFGAEASVAEVLRDGGVTAVSVANNHAGDQGATGVRSTREILDEAGVRAFGVGGEPLQVNTLDVKGMSVGVVALTTVLNFELPEGAPALPFLPLHHVADRVTPLLRRARAAHDLLVVSVHWGNEYENTPTPLQRRTAAALVQAGADIVAGHHPHVLQPIDVIDGSIVAYSLGNFLFDAASPQARVSGILTLDVVPRDCTARLGFVPAQVSLYPRLRPILATGESAALSRGQVQRGTQVQWSRAGEVLTASVSLGQCVLRLDGR